MNIIFDCIIGFIVVEDYCAVVMFIWYGIDFCCKGG